MYPHYLFLNLDDHGTPCVPSRVERGAEICRSGELCRRESHRSLSEISPLFPSRHAIMPSRMFEIYEGKAVFLPGIIPNLSIGDFLESFNKIWLETDGNEDWSNQDVCPLLIFWTKSSFCDIHELFSIRIAAISNSSESVTNRENFATDCSVGASSEDWINYRRWLKWVNFNWKFRLPTNESMRLLKSRYPSYLYCKIALWL